LQLREPAAQPSSPEGTRSADQSQQNLQVMPECCSRLLHVSGGQGLESTPAAGRYGTANETGTRNDLLDSDVRSRGTAAYLTNGPARGWNGVQVAAYSSCPNHPIPG
jgi:hypothetical protein